ncbi:MAG: hypothetical protein KKB70_03200, partial [Proteobacteria bacterium]|nr:hypothetical protein [Pseudomonadota bacterium]
VLMTSALDGGGSAFMVLRVGIIARNYMSLRLIPGRSARRMASLEAGKMFGEVSVGTVTSIATALVTATGGIIYKGAARAAGLTADAATSSGSALAGGAKTALTGVGGAGKKSATVLAKAVRTTGNLLAKNAITLGTIAGKNLGTGVRAAALGAKNGAGFVVGKMKGLVRRKRDEA